MMSPDQLNEIISNPSSTLSQKNTAREVLTKMITPVTSYDPNAEALYKLWQDKLAYYSQIITEGGQGAVTVESCQQIVDRLGELLRAAGRK
jgi:hypothetical protein